MGSPTEREARCYNTGQDRRRPGYAGGRAVYDWEARLCGRPTTKICIDMESKIGRRPYEVYMGSPTGREAR